MSYAISRHYNANVEAHWYIGQYVLPGNVQRIILKPKALPLRALAQSCRRIVRDTVNSASRPLLHAVMTPARTLRPSPPRAAGAERLEWNHCRADPAGTARG